MWRIVSHSEKKGECLLAYKEGKMAWLDTNRTGGIVGYKEDRGKCWIQRIQRRQGELLDTKKTGGIVGYKEDKEGRGIVGYKEDKEDRGNCWIQRRQGKLLDTEKTAGTVHK